MPETARQQVRFHRTRWHIGFATLAVGVFIFAVHWFQNDWLAPVTMVPPWLWLMAAIIGFAISFRSATTSMKLLILAIWICFAVLFVEEASSVYRKLTGVQQKATSTSIRVATLNCCFGTTDSIYEIDKHAPDGFFFRNHPVTRPLQKYALIYWELNRDGSAVAIHPSWQKEASNRF